MLRLVQSDTPRSVTREMFKDLCPSLVYQIDSDSCHTAHTAHARDDDGSAVHDHFFNDHEHHSHEHGSHAESVRINLIMVPAKGIVCVCFCKAGLICWGCRQVAPGMKIIELHSFISQAHVVHDTMCIIALQFVFPVHIWKLTNVKQVLVYYCVQ